MEPAQARTTAQFSVAARGYLPHVAARLFWNLWWTLLPPAVAIAYGLIADWRWIIVGLILLLIIYPMVMTLAVIRYAASGRILRRSATTAVTFGPDGTISMLNSNGDVIERAAMPPYTTTSRGRLVISLGHSPDDFLLIPLEAIYDT